MQTHHLRRFVFCLTLQRLEVLPIPLHKCSADESQRDQTLKKFAHLALQSCSIGISPEPPRAMPPPLETTRVMVEATRRKAPFTPDRLLEALALDGSLLKTPAACCPEAATSNVTEPPDGARLKGPEGNRRMPAGPGAAWLAAPPGTGYFSCQSSPLFDE